jgi:hypothetical protein
MLFLLRALKLFYNTPEEVRYYLDIYKSSYEPKILCQNDKVKYFFQRIQKELFYYTSDENINLIDFDEFSIVDNINRNFQILQIGTFAAPRFVWSCWLGLFLLQSQIIYSAQKTQGPNGDTVWGAYLKTVVRDPNEFFKDFCQNTIGVGYENASCDGMLLQFNWKDMNEYLHIIDNEDFPGYKCKVQYFRFDSRGENNHDYNAKLFIKAKNRLRKFLWDNSRGFEGFDILFNYFGEMGLNAVPLDNFCHFSYKELNHKTKASDIIKILAKKGLTISSQRAKNIQTFIGGIVRDPSFTNFNSIGFRRLIIGKSIIPEIEEKNSHSISVYLTSLPGNRRSILNTTKKEVLKRYGYSCFNKGKSEFDSYECASEYMRIRTCAKVFGMQSNEYITSGGSVVSCIRELRRKTNWDIIWDTFELDKKMSYHFHHVVFKKTLLSKGADWIDCNDRAFLIPMNSHEHIKTPHNNEYETTIYMIQKGWISYSEACYLWKNIMERIISMTPPGVRENSDLIGYLNTLVGEFLREGIDGKISSNC